MPNAAYQLPSLGSTVAGKYILEAELGRGGMGAVFRARHLVTGRQVAIKWMLPSTANDTNALARFLREAKLASAVSHENIVEIYDIGQDASGAYLIMELLNGRSLAERLKSDGPMTLAELVDVLGPIAAGLQQAHDAGIVHRDLKPDNVFLAEARNAGAATVPKIVDFGMSKTTHPSKSAVNLTGTGIAMGTPYYMSPEQVMSAADVDHRADIYSLGIIAYEALSGTVPFDGPTVTAVFLNAATETPRPLHKRVPSVNRRAAAVVHKAMSKDASDRFGSVIEFVAQLKANVADPLERTRPWSSRSLLMVGVLLCTILIAGGGWALFRMLAVPAESQLTLQQAPGREQKLDHEQTGTNRPDEGGADQALAPIPTPIGRPLPRLTPVVSPVATPIAAQQVVPEAGTVHLAIVGSLGPDAAQLETLKRHLGRGRTLSSTNISSSEERAIEQLAHADLAELPLSWRRSEVVVALQTVPGGVAGLFVIYPPSTEPRLSLTTDIPWSIPDVDGWISRIAGSRQ